MRFSLEISEQIESSRNLIWKLIISHIIVMASKIFWLYLSKWYKEDEPTQKKEDPKTRQVVQITEEEEDVTAAGVDIEQDSEKEVPATQVHDLWMYPKRKKRKVMRVM